ncbi:MAG: hypothetical protein ACKER6_00730 [Candidatus Hodgkinia cicadicola]
MVNTHSSCMVGLLRRPTGISNWNGSTQPGGPDGWVLMDEHFGNAHFIDGFTSSLSVIYELGCCVLWGKMLVRL